MFRDWLTVIDTNTNEAPADIMGAFLDDPEKTI